MKSLILILVTGLGLGLNAQAVPGDFHLVEPHSQFPDEDLSGDPTMVTRFKLDCDGGSANTDWSTVYMKKLGERHYGVLVVHPYSSCAGRVDYTRSYELVFQHEELEAAGVSREEMVRPRYTSLDPRDFVLMRPDEVTDDRVYFFLKCKDDQAYEYATVVGTYDDSGDQKIAAGVVYDKERCSDNSDWRRFYLPHAFGENAVPMTVAD